MIVSLDTYRRRRCKPYATVWFISERAAQLFGEHHRLQPLYAWTRAEAEQIARDKGGKIVEEKP